jgi:hypothetical protein
MLTPELKHFGATLASLGYNETVLAVSLIWYLQHMEGAAEVSASKAAKLIHDLALRGQVNTSRLAGRLAQHSDIVRGKAANTFKIKLSELAKLTEEFEPLLNRPKPRVEPHVVSKDEFAQVARKYLLAMIEQINGCYQFGFYDGCAVMCRRLMETLLIEVFEHNSAGAKIKAQGEYVGLRDIIAQAKSGHHFKLQRGTADVMEAIKLLGDTAAHSRMYITKQQDIDDVRFKFRKMISELLHLAGMS